MKTFIPYQKSLKPNSRKLRTNQTDAERKLWSRLRRKQLLDYSFYRQKPVLNYIVDFYCPKAKLIIELDGSQHYELEHQENDKLRDFNLAKLGFSVLRFDNRQILWEIESVVEIIYQRLIKLREIP